VVAWAVERDRPVALSLNEACYDDGVQLGGRLAGLVGGAGYSALDTAVGCPGAIKRFGNLVLVGGGLAPRGAAWGQFRTQADGPCDHRTDECRGMVCVDAGPVGRRRAFCSAHLESPRRAPGVAVDQAREYLAMVDARFGDHRARVLAGDFNLGRSDTDDVLGSAGYRAAAAGPSVGPRPSGGPEIDRIYDDGAHSTEVVGATYCDRQASDHCYLTTASAVLADPGRAA
jgi:endonuclease/exonuclease/phosphatase family metal-dependent hydrolase